MSQQYNASNPKHIKEAGEREKFRRQRLLNDVRTLVATAEGRRLFTRIFDLTGINRSSFTGNSETFFLEGKRSIGLEFMVDLMEAKPDAYLQMIEEARREEANA